MLFFMYDGKWMMKLYIEINLLELKMKANGNGKRKRKMVRNYLLWEGRVGGEEEEKLWKPLICRDDRMIVGIRLEGESIYRGEKQKWSVN